VAEGRRWRTRAAEGLTIVVSILLALIADAAWDYRSDRVDERALIAALRTEFAEAADEIANDIAARDEILARTEQFLEARQTKVIPLAADSLPAALTDLLNWRFYTPGHAVLEDAVESDRLDLIRSDAVRGELMAYIQARERLPVFEAMERDFVADRMEPYLGAEVALDLAMLGTPDRTLLEPETARLTSLMADPTFGSLLYVRRDRSVQAQLYSRIVQRAIARVREALGDGTR